MKSDSPGCLVYILQQQQDRRGVPDRNISEVKGIETFEALALRAVQALQALHLGLHALLVLSGLRP